MTTLRAACTRVCRCDRDPTASCKASAACVQPETHLVSVPATTSMARQQQSQRTEQAANVSEQKV